VNEPVGITFDPAALASMPAPPASVMPPTPVVVIGHVDHGKSTLIGRLLHDTGNLADGGLAAAAASSARRGLGVEWSFLLDSLQAERDQGVTIDTTRTPLLLDGRRFVLIDAPGHRQFLRNMVTGAAGAAAAVLVVDAAEGTGEQTRRHAVLLRLLGLRHVIVALNKVDLLEFDAARVTVSIRAVIEELARLQVVPAAIVPLSARHGDNLIAASPRMPWHDGPSLTQVLSLVPPPASLAGGALRLPVQDVYRLEDRRVIVGRIESGRLRVGDPVVVGATGATARIAAFEGWPTVPDQAAAGAAVALRLDPDVVATRGDLLHDPARPPLRAARLHARLFWLRPERLRVGESFRLRLATAEYAVTVVEIRNVLDIGTLTEQPAEHVPPEGFAEITLAAAESVLFDPFTPDGAGGRGVLVDARQQIVGGVPLIGPAPLSPGVSVFPTDSAVSVQERAGRRGHRSFVFWMTGLPGAGKSTIARAAEAMLFRQGIDVVVLDGDTLRARLSPDLGFSPADRRENIRRVAAVARLLADAGHVVITALISPGEADRALARDTVGAEFHEVHVHADRETCERRDPKGLYAAARAGRLSGFTGVDAPYDEPRSPELRLDTMRASVLECVSQLAAHVAAVVMPKD
jgi:bifunctional enzyme CysN/CysC